MDVDIAKQQSIATTRYVSPSLGDSVAPSINEDEDDIRPTDDGYSIFEDDHDDRSRADTLESTGLHDLPMKPRIGDLVAPRLKPRHSHSQLPSNFSSASRPATAISGLGSIAGSTSTSRPSTAAGRAAHSGALTLYNANSYVSVQESLSKALDKLSQLLDKRRNKVLAIANRAEFSQFLNRRRIKHMPHRGSVLDRILKRAELFSLAVDQYSQALNSAENPLLDASRLVMSCMQLMLEVSPDKLLIYFIR
jgi:hypothetical protein